MGKRLSLIDSCLKSNISSVFVDIASRKSLTNSLFYDCDFDDETRIEGIAFDIDSILDDWSNCESEETLISEVDLESITPYEYESLIANELSRLGWEAQVTSGSGDQGADVLAEINGYRVVVQCKLYSQPVGNKAVQEAHAALGFYDANYACVVTNSSFTKSASQLADSLDVALLHHDELAVFNSLVEEESED